MDRFESMSMFVAVVAAGGFSSASRRLRVPLATVSRKVSELEQHLGARLLNRTTRSVTLTESGQHFLEACRQILDQLSEAERTASGEYKSPRGELVLTAPIVFGRLHALPVVIEFLKAYPDVDVQLVLVDRNVDLLDEHVDLAVRIGELPDSTMMSTRIGSIRRVVCASPAYLAERGTPRHPRDLVAHDCVTVSALASPKAWSFRDGRREVEFVVRSRLTVTTVEAAIDAAVAGHAETRVLSYQVAEAIRCKRLVAILVDYQPDAVPVSLVYPSGRFLPIKLRAFLDFAGPRLKSRVLARTRE
ncbi:MAG: LysR family transcriptional regulator [Hyphomicrobiaceae bacterium]|nr:MAG: LysR family transcriptional regulator [Hyphomicrobiaceae bacterium]